MNQELVDDLKIRLHTLLDDWEWHHKKIIFLEDQISLLRKTIAELEKA